MPKWQGWRREIVESDLIAPVKATSFRDFYAFEEHVRTARGRRGLEMLPEWYEAPVAALSFSDNCILVRVSPGRAGQPAIVETVPPVNVFRVDNTTSTRAARRGTKLFVGRTGDLLTVRGTIDVRSGPFETWVTVPDPHPNAKADTAFAEGMLRELMPMLDELCRSEKKGC